MSDGSDRATVSTHHKKDDAIIELHEDFFGRTPEGQRQTLVHEVLHLQTARLCRAFTQLAKQFPEHGAIAYAAQRHDDEEEIVVDRLARAIAPLMPLPPTVEDA